MKLAIVAATGRIGRLTLDQAVAAGHDVTAIARRPEGLGVRSVAVDFTKPDLDVLTDAIAGADAVISGLGPRTRTEDGIVSTGTKAVVDAMTAAGVHRLVAVTVQGVAMREGEADDPGVGWFTRAVLSKIARARLGKHFDDVAATHDLLRRSEVDWTAACLPYLTDNPPTGKYRTAYDQSVRGGWKLGRADAAAFLLKALTLPETVRHCVAVAY